KKTNRIGKVFFENMDIEATHLTNIDLDREDFPETKVNFKTRFMGSSPLKVTWTFQINQKADNFRIRGHGRHIPPEAINSFFTPAFNMKAKGKGVNDLYFDFYGNNKTAQGHFKMVYKDLKIEVLKKGGKERNKFLSFIAGIFVKSKKTSSDEQVDVSAVKRDIHRSFWNYFWQCMFSGIKKTLL